MPAGHVNVNEKIVKAAIQYIDTKNIKSTVIETGKNHLSIQEKMEKEKPTFFPQISGFVTESGKFLTREEATILAKQNGQLDSKSNRLLQSDDL